MIYISVFIVLLGILFVVIFNKPNIEPSHTEVAPTASDISVLNPPEQSEISLEQISSSTHPSTTEPVASTSPTAVVQSKKESTPKVTLPPEPKAVPKTNTATQLNLSGQTQCCPYYARPTSPYLVTYSSQRSSSLEWGLKK